MKQKLLAMLVLVMTAMTASAKTDTPTYSLTVGTNEHGSVTFTVGDNPTSVTAAAEGVTVTMTVNSHDGWSVYEPTGVWDAAIARVQAQNATIPVSRDVELTPVNGQSNAWTFTMKRANAHFSISYRKLLTNADITISDISPLTYTGQELEPTVTVKDGETTLVAGTDYTVSYSNNTNAALSTATENAPAVTITAVATSDQYDGSATKTFTIQQAALTVTADNQNVAFGDDAPLYTATYDGFVNNETSAVLDGTLSFSCPYEKNVSNTGTYEIIPSGQTSDNYDITFAKGTLTVGKKSLEYSSIASIGDQTYTGQAIEPLPAVTYNNMTLVKDRDYTVSYSDNVNAGTATVTITAVESSNYSGTASATFSITQKVITVHGITAKNKIYDGNKIAELIYDGIVFDGKKEGDKLTVTATGRFTNPDVGTLKIVLIRNLTLHGKDKDNYTLASSGNQGSTTASITKRRLSVTAKPKTICYGDEPDNGGVEYFGFVNGETSSILSGTLQYAYNTQADGLGDPYEAGSPVGSYYIILSGLSAQNYKFVYYTGVLTVEPKSVALAETDDNTQTLSESDNAVSNVTLTRTLQPGSWNTFAVPFDLGSDELAARGITAKELTGSSFVDGALTLTFENAESIKAGKPYLVQVEAAMENPTFENVTVKKEAVTIETDAVNFIPTLGKTLVTGPAGDEDNPDAVLFLVTGNKLANPTTVNTPDKQSSYMKGFRAFFQLKGEAAMSNLRLYSIDFGDGEMTEIVGVDSGELTVDSDASWYDLQGRKLDGEPTTKGVYIKNGKKVVVN